MAKTTIVVERKGDQLLINIPCKVPPTPSKSGKTLLIASTHGNIKTSCVFKQQQVVVSVNAYVYADKEK